MVARFPSLEEETEAEAASTVCILFFIRFLANFTQEVSLWLGNAFAREAAKPETHHKHKRIIRNKYMEKAYEEHMKKKIFRERERERERERV